MNKTYRVVIGGLKEGFSKDQVNINLANLFKTTIEKLPDISSESNYVVKKNLDKETAEKYQSAIEKQGCKCLIEPEVDVKISLDDPLELPPEIPSDVGVLKTTKFCRNCGYELPVSAKFCRGCGSLQPKKVTEQPTTQENYKQFNIGTATEKKYNTMFVVVACIVAIVIGGIGYIIWTKNGSPTSHVSTSTSVDVEKYQSGIPDNARALKDLFGIESSGEPVKTGTGELNAVWFHQDFKYGKNNMYVFFVKTQNTDLETGQVESCHACAPSISTVTYKQAGDKWVLASKNSKFIHLGQFGDTPEIKGKLEELKIGPDKTAYLIDSGYMNQGESVMHKEMFAYDESGWRSIGLVETSGSNTVNEGDPNGYSYDGKITTRIGKNQNYYDIVVVMTGTTPAYTGNSAQPTQKAENIVYIYNGIIYEQEKVSNPVATKAEASSVSQQLTVTDTIPKEFHGTWAVDSVCQQLKAGKESDSIAEITSNNINRYEQYCVLSKSIKASINPAKSSNGTDVYKSTCAACHASGLMGAPAVGNKDQWKQRIDQGRDVLVANAINGIRLMPKRGGNVKLSNVDIESAVVFMANQSGANFNEVAVKPNSLFSGEFSCNQEGSTATQSISLTLQSDGKLTGLFDNSLIKCN